MFVEKTHEAGQEAEHAVKGAVPVGSAVRGLAVVWGNERKMYVI